MKSGWYGITESPIFITSLPPCLKVCFKSTGSSAGSSASNTFSITTGLPKRTAFSSVRKKSLSLGLHTSHPASASMFLIHLFAWVCGSMQSGHRRECERMIPFSLDTRSAGRPCTCQPRSLTASAITFPTVAPSVCLTPSAASPARHVAARSVR